VDVVIECSGNEHGTRMGIARAFELLRAAETMKVLVAPNG
jgi:hypothetical protein